MNYLKAVYGAVVAFLGSLGTVLVGSESFTDVTDAQWVSIAIATLGALGVIWAVPNSKVPAAPSDPVPAPVPAPPLPAEPPQ